jgi:hypothetical protein
MAAVTGTTLVEGATPPARRARRGMRQFPV